MPQKNQLTEKVQLFVKIQLIAVTLFALSLPAVPARAAVIFQDDFENQAAGWNVGDGPLSTPVGQNGEWDVWEVKRFTSMGCPASPAGLPASADGYVVYLRPNGGYNGTKGVAINVASCMTDLNGWVGGTRWVAPAASNYADLYIGSHVKLDQGIGVLGNDGWWKMGWWIVNNTDNNIYWDFINNNPSEWNNNLVGSSDSWAFASGGMWECSGLDWANAMPQEAVFDGEWHWIEHHIKYNTASALSDAVYQVWLDGDLVYEKNNFRTWCAGSIPKITWVYFYIGNACGPDNCGGQARYANSSAEGINFDNIKIGTTYIGPPGGVIPPDTTPPAAPTGLAVQ